jgi:hypothetical protein
MPGALNSRILLILPLDNSLRKAYNQRQAENSYSLSQKGEV